MSTLTNTRPWLRGQHAATANSISGIARCGLLVVPMLLGAPVVDAAECPAAATYQAIQDCINSSSPGDTIRIAAGTAELDSSQIITIPNEKLGITLVGAGVHETVIRGPADHEVLIEVGELGGTPSGATIIEHITFDGRTPTGSVGRAIRVISSGLSATVPAIVRHCEFIGFTNGIVFGSNFNSRYWMIGPDNLFDYSRYGVQLNQADDIVISGNVFRGYEIGVRTVSTFASNDIEIIGNRFDGGSRLPATSNYIGIFLTGTSSTGVPKNWRIRDNLITGATWGIGMIRGVAPSNFDGVDISGNCLDENTVLGSGQPPPATADIYNPTDLPVIAPNNFGGSANPQPVTIGPVSVVPWLKDIVYTGSTAVGPGDAVILEATVHNTDGTVTGSASGVLVRFFRTPVGGSSTSEVGIGVTDVDGRAVVEAGVWDIGTYDINVKAAGGCLTGKGSVAVRQEASTTVYSGQTYTSDSPVTVLAAISPPASSTVSCGGPSNPGPVSFVAAPVGGGETIAIAGVDLAPASPPPYSRTTVPVTMALQPGVYLMTVSYAGGGVCLPSSDTAVVVVAGPGDSASGGGWYMVGGFAPPRANFGFTIQNVMQRGQTAGYKGQLLWMNNNRWRLKGVIDTDAAAYGTFPCPNWTSYAGASDNPVCAAFRGSGLLETWDATSMQWLPATAYGNLGAVTFTATLYDGGSASICKKKTCGYGDVADYFGIQIDPVPGTVLPESLPMMLTGGSIRAQ